MGPATKIWSDSFLAQKKFFCNLEMSGFNIHNVSYMLTYLTCIMLVRFRCYSVVSSASYSGLNIFIFMWIDFHCEYVDHSLLSYDVITTPRVGLLSFSTKSHSS
jgi:hypothetical protein